VRLLYGVLLAAILTPGLAVAQADSPSTPAASAESDWIGGKDILTAPGKVVTAPARALGKLFKHVHVPTTPAPEEAESTGWVGFVQVQSNTTPLGGVFILNPDFGYKFTPHFTVEAGLPILFDRSPFSKVANSDWRWTTWIVGQPYVDVRYTAKPAGASFTSILTGAIPVASPIRSFSTGRFGVDWFNHLEKSFSGVTPFVNFGAANGTVNRFVMPRPYSIARQYQTLGFISDFEGGIGYRFLKGLEIGGSAYALVPGGPQKVFSRLVSPDYALAGDAAHNRYFNNAFETIGPSDIARDNGYSGWFEVKRLGHATLQFGYTRSIHYAYDSLTVVLNIDLGYMFREPTQ
jgi:hypothetical protein